MKTIKINESQKARLFEGYKEGFSFETLSAIGGGELGYNNAELGQYKYCCKYFGEPEYQGSSRIVFTLGDNTVLKVAYGMRPAGIMQNKNEYKMFNDTRSPILTRVYAADTKRFTWLVSELVLPIEFEDFEKILGIPFYYQWVQNKEDKKQWKQDKRGNEIEGEGSRYIGFNKYFDNLKEPGEYYDGICVSDILYFILGKYHNGVIKIGPDDDKFEKIIEKIPFFKELKKLAYTTPLRDFTSVGNFGIVNRDGKPQIVLLDSGFDDKIYDKYYDKDYE